MSTFRKSKSKSMKKLIPLFSIALLVAACNTTPKIETVSSGTIQQPVQSVPDTAGLAKFQQWKAGNELADVNEYGIAPQVASAPAKVRTIIKTVKVPAQKATAKGVTPKVNTNTSTEESSGTGSSTAAGEAIGSESSQTAKAEKKEGWSKAAKGAVIGGIGGAVGGAVINKQNRVVGAVIGAVIGAGGGYAIGRGMDKKDGRIEFNK
jgi:hypothetical protein